MRAGLIERRKNSSFSLFLEKRVILGSCLARSAMKLSMGRKSFFRPFARMCARYLESLDSSDRASLGVRAKLRMMARRKSSRRESASLSSFLGSTSLRLISAG
jgi:hypothetical protein